MHKHRKKIGRKRFFKKVTKRYEGGRQVCPIYQAESLVVDKNGNKICRNCEKTSKIHKKLKIKQVAKNLVSKQSKTKDIFQRENTLEEIVIYLKNQETNNMSLKFWYRDDIKPREVNDYFIDKKYIQVRSDKGYFIKFLIDRIRKIY